MTTSFGSNFTQRLYTWTQWKAVYAIKGLPFQYEDDGNIYCIWSYDGNEVLFCQIFKGNVPESSQVDQSQNDSNKTDFETNYKAQGNQSLSQIDTDGAAIFRIKAAKRGWSYCACAFEFSTSKLNSVVALNVDGTSKSWITHKLFDANGNEITDPLLVNTAVMTRVEFEPPYDYEVIGGEMRTSSDMNSDIRMFIVAVPDVPYAYGGTRVMCENLNLKYLYPGNVFQVDGRVSKFLSYNASFHTNKLRFVFWHSAGVEETLMITIEHYRQ